MLTVITLETIKSCPVALPSPKGFGQGLARVLLLTRKFRTLTLPPPFCFLPWSRIAQKGPLFFNINIFFRDIDEMNKIAQVISGCIALVAEAGRRCWLFRLSYKAKVKIANLRYKSMRNPTVTRVMSHVY